MHSTYLNLSIYVSTYLSIYLSIYLSTWADFPHAMPAPDQKALIDHGIPLKYCHQNRVNYEVYGASDDKTPLIYAKSLGIVSWHWAYRITPELVLLGVNRG